MLILQKKLGFGLINLHSLELPSLTLIASSSFNHHPYMRFKFETNNQTNKIDITASFKTEHCTSGGTSQGNFVFYYVPPGETRVGTFVPIPNSHGVETTPVTVSPTLSTGVWQLTATRTEVHNTEKIHLTVTVAANGALSNWDLQRYPYLDICNGNAPISQTDITNLLVYTES